MRLPHEGNPARSSSSVTVDSTGFGLQPGKQPAGLLQRSTVWCPCVDDQEAPTGFQNTAARAVLQSDNRAEPTALLQSLHWLPVCQRIVYETALLTYKVQETLLPAYLHRHLDPNVTARSTRSASRPLLTVPTQKTEFARRSFS